MLRKRVLLNRLRLVPLLLLALFSCSCNSYKDIAYFRDIPDSVVSRMDYQPKFTQPIIQSDDILDITIQTIDPVSSSVMNQSVNSGEVMGRQIFGYLVDKSGEVEVAMIGKVKLAGLTTDQAREVIRSSASRYYKEPYVQVRFANFKVTVIGEVAKPSAYVMPNEKVSILDALGAAGDLTIFGKRENVLLIREDLGKKQFVRLNLTDSKLFHSPFFYLKQNDVIYVEPNKGKAASTDASRNRLFAIVTSIVSLAAIAITRF